MATYLVTGGAGFIGSNIVEELVRRGRQVRVLDNLSTGRLSNIRHLQAQVDFIEADVTDRAALREAVRGVDFILHQAALPSVPRSVEDPFGSHQANATGTLELLIAARDESVKRVVYASSSSVYGDNPSLPKVETMPVDPLSPYAVNKLAGEQYCKVFTRLYGLPTVALRYFNVFGPRQDPSSQYAAVIPAFINLMLDGKQPVVHGDGTQSRDFTYVSNVVEANLLACESEAGVGEALNIACGERISLLDLITELNTLLGTSIAPYFTESRAGDVKHSLASIDKARDELGYEPRWTLTDGLQKTVDYFRGLRTADVG